MKKGNKFFKVANRFSIPTLLALIFVSAATLLWGVGVLPNIAKAKQFKSFFGRFILIQNNGTLPEILGNIVAYSVIAAGIVLMILVLAKVKHNKGLKAKAAVLSCLMIWPASLGLLDGVFDLMPHGYYTLTGAKDVNASLLLFLIIFTYVLDVVYVLFAITVAVHALREAKQVEKGIVPVDEDERPVQHQPCCSEEEKQKRHEQLLEDIRRIVREELNKLDRVAIITESEAPIEEEEPAPAEEEPAPAPEVEEADASKIPSGPRVPFAEKIVSADKDIKDKYNELKNEILAYGPASRLSVSGDTFRLHRKAYVKITLVGKTLKVYFALNPNDYVDSPIPVADAGDKTSYADVPALLKVRSDLSLRRAKELVAATFAADGIEKGEVGQHNHVKDIAADLKAKK